MSGKPKILERAFKIAGSGTAKSLVEVKARLQQEGFSDDDLEQLNRLIVLRQLTGEIASARAGTTANAYCEADRGI
jgi:hypothetical protein